MPHFTNIGSFTAEIWRLIDFQDGGRCGALLLPYRIWWRHFFQKVDDYQHRQDNSIHGREITVSVLQRQTSAILKFFFRFWLWPHSLSVYRISSTSEHWLRKYDVIRHIHFSRWRPQPLNTTSGFVFVDVTAFRRSKSIRNQISSTYLNFRLRYYYFRFWKTNVRHIGIILPVLMSTTTP